MEHALKTWHFDTDNDRLVRLVLSGKKTAVTSLYGKDAIPAMDEEAILVFDNEKKACVTKTKNVMVTEFKRIPEELSRLEGEGSFGEWERARTDAFKSMDPNFCEDTKVVFQIFEVTKNLVEQRLELAGKIARANEDLLGAVRTIREINAGFNNHIFCVNDKYILKICGDAAKERLFDVEANFYRAHQGSENLPVLYRYDSAKKVVPYAYEILEKIDGRSVYYHWYKMDERQREALVRELVQVLRRLHAKKYPPYDWCAFIKERILSSFRQTTDMFCEEERVLILESLEKYEEILKDNTFCLIHNDLHFDNILLDEKQTIRLIDFNDSFVAPFDFDLRLLYISVSLPWKWANTEMDPLQKPKDYQNLFCYVKKYYPELNAVRHLDERMLIYWIFDDFMLLPRFKGREEKERILVHCKKILEGF